MSALPFMAVFANSSLINMGTVYFPLLGLGGLLTLGLIALMARNYDKRFVKSKKSLYIGLGIKMVLIAVVQVLAFRFIAEQSLIAAVSSIAMTGCIIVCYKNSEAYTLCQSNARKVARF